MTIVIDASVALAWSFEDERTPAIARLFRSVGEGGAMVPSLWPLEVANGFRMAMRRGRIDTAFRNRALRAMERLSIEIDDQTSGNAWTSTLRIADESALTPYDAAYLELALRRRLPLATLDQALVSAARREGVATHPLID